MQGSLREGAPDGVGWGRVREERIAVEILREENVRAAGSFHRPDKEHQSVYLSFAAVPLPPGGRHIKTVHLHGYGLSNIGCLCFIELF